MKTLTTFLAPLLVFTCSFAQEMGISGFDVVGADTIPSVTLDEVRVFTKHFNNIDEEHEFNRLRNNTYKVYPYVQTAVKIYYEMQHDLATIDKRRQQKTYINGKEKELRDKFEKDIRNLTKTQGNILIKLINRETGNNCYTIVKDMKGPVVAFFWNMAGKLYDHDLKEEYIPEENKDLEFIVKMIKNEPMPGE